MESEHPAAFNNITARPDRRKCFYNSLERAIIDPFKEAYLKAKDPAERRDITISLIFPPLFMHWEAVEKRQLGYEERKQRIDDLLAWIRNNWQSNSDETFAANFVVESTTVLWLQRRDEVFEEIAKLLGVPKADTLTKGWFGKRMEAMGNILRRMSASEKQEIEAEAGRILREGYDVDQKRRLAKKYAAVRMDTMAKNQWLEMGLISLSFVISSTETGQLSIEIHNQMAEMMGKTAESFETKWPDKVKQMERLLTSYVRELQGRVPGVRDAEPLHADGPGAERPKPNGKQKALIFELTNEGYPIVPANFVPEDHNKAVLENMFRRYLSLHYKLATNGRVQKVPYADVEKDMRTYVDKQYLPKKFVIKEPKNMKVAHLKSFFSFVLGRQLTQETAQVFHFKNVNFGRPKKIKPAYTPDGPKPDGPEPDGAEPAADAAPPERQKKIKRKKRGPKSKSNGTVMTFENPANPASELTPSDQTPMPNLQSTQTPMPSQISNDMIDPQLLTPTERMASSGSRTPTPMPMPNIRRPPHLLPSSGSRTPTPTPMPNIRRPPHLLPTPSPTPAPMESNVDGVNDGYLAPNQHSYGQHLAVPVPQYGQFVFPPPEQMLPQPVIPELDMASGLGSRARRKSKKK